MDLAHFKMLIHELLNKDSDIVPEEVPLIVLDIFVGIPEHQKVYLVYVPSTRKVISSYDVVFDKSFSSALSYTSRPYSEAMAMRPAVMYNPYAISSREQTGAIIMFAQFEEGNILTETSSDTGCTLLSDA